MKASDLMIDDWVYCHQPECKGHRIDYIHEADEEVGADGEIYSIDDIDPIPLTSEILEKNGFTHSFGDSDFYDYEKWEKKVDNKTIRVIKDHDGWFCRVDDNKLTRSMGIAPAVHTMQNIIRIGGIDWNLEL